MAICCQIRRQNLIPRFTSQPISAGRRAPGQRMRGGQRRGGERQNFLSLSVDFFSFSGGGTYTNTVAEYIQEIGLGVGANTVAFSHPEDTLADAVWLQEMVCHL